MMNDVDEKTEEAEGIDIEKVVECLFNAYHTCNYIALNPALTTSNQESWKDRWYFIGFVEQPMYVLFEGMPRWIANKDVATLDDEWGLFFLHISSKDHFYHGLEIQKSRYDFASPRFFCWKRTADGIVQLVSEEAQIDDNALQAGKNLKELIDNTMLKPLAKALKPNE